MAKLKQTKKQAKLKSFMFTQSCESKHFNTLHEPVNQTINGQLIPMFHWSDSALQHVENHDIDSIIDDVRFMLCSSTLDTESYYNDDVVKNIYGIIHDSDTREIWDKTIGDYVVENKFIHFHIVIELGVPMTIDEIAFKLNVEPQFIEKPKSGPYGYNNLLAYLIHAKDTDKWQYSPDLVASHPKNESSYDDVYSVNRASWIAGAAKKSHKRAVTSVESLESLILSGECTRDNIMFNDELFMVYAANKRRIDDAFNSYVERKMAYAIRDIENGEFRTCIFFITGKSSAGKSYFTRQLARQIVDTVREREHKNWAVLDCAKTNPVDKYAGEEILMMDDLRGASLSASDWFGLLNPESGSDVSARYNNKTMVPRCIIINSVQDPLTYFYYAKNIGGGDRSEPMDQFLRRIIARVQMYAIPDPNEPNNPYLTERYHTIGVCELTDKRTVVIEKTRYGYDDKKVDVNYDYIANYLGRDLADLTAADALAFLVNTVWYWSFGKNYTENEIIEVVGSADNYIHNADIQPKPNPVSDSQEYWGFLVEATIDDIIAEMSDMIANTTDPIKISEYTDTINGLKNGTLTVEFGDDKIIKIVENKEVMNDDN